MAIVGIVGTRRRDTLVDFLLVEAAFRKVYMVGDRICSGGCSQGGDRFAEIIAIMLARPGHPGDTAENAMGWLQIKRHHLLRELGAPFLLHPADWHKHGRSAGFQRNGLIARDSDWLIASVAANRTGGTEHTIKLFLKKGKPEQLILV